MIIQSRTLSYYKRDRSGNIREWFAEIACTECTWARAWAWRANTGIQYGAMVQSGWKIVEAKNVGRANETTPEDQALFEATAEAKKKCDKGYFKDIKKIDTFDKFKPMLAFEYSKVKTIDFPVVAQPKLDGIRCIARADGLWTRAGKALIAVPHVAEDLVEFFKVNPDAILDGELYNHDLRDDFNKLSSLIRKTKPTQDDIDECKAKVQYWVYDSPTDATLSIDDRLCNIISKLEDVSSVVLVPSIHVDTKQSLDNLYGKWLEEGYEGQMVRNPDGEYETGKRSKNLLKRKEFIDTEFKVLRIEEGVGNWAGYIIALYWNCQMVESLVRTCAETKLH